jgi:hypothetical protein
MAAKPPLHEIRLLLETDDESEIERLSDAIASLACPHRPSDDHRCAIPWLVVSAPVEKAKKWWRDLLNR